MRLPEIKKQEDFKKKLNSGAPRLNTQKRAIDRRARPPQIQTTDMDHQVQFTHVRYKIPIHPQTTVSNESQPIMLERHHLSAPLRQSIGNDNQSVGSVVSSLSDRSVSRGAPVQIISP
jgi:hypothetical protein